MKIHLPRQASQDFVGVRYGLRETVIVFFHLDECMLFRGCFSVSSCEAKTTSLCLPRKRGDPELVQFHAGDVLEQPCCHP